jgi:hypothetical protein
MIKWLLLSALALAMALMLGGCDRNQGRPYLNLYVCSALVSTPDQQGEVQIISVDCPRDLPEGGME